MRNSNTIVNYGPNLPPTGSVPDGSVFYVTQGVDTGFHIHRFSSDSNFGTIGEQAGYKWETATAAGVDAATLGGHASSYFEPQSVNLDALSTQAKLGFVNRTGVGAYNNIALLEGNGLTFTSVAGTTADFNLTLSVNEAELAINSIGGTLGIAKGGTNSTTVTAGGVAYGTATAIATTAAGTATSGTGIAQNWQVLASAGAGAPIWVNATSLNVAHSTVSASVTFATTAGVANAVTWTNVTSKPTTIAGFGITDALTTTQTNTADYLNFSPFAGTLKDNKVPVYADFPFSQGRWNTGTFTWVDRHGKQVAFYDTNTPVGAVFCYRAYRYSDADAWVYDNIPVSVSFALQTEKVYAITNMGTNCAVLWLGTIAFPLTKTRTVIVKTNGSSDCNDWAFAYDVSTIANAFTGSNFGLVPTVSGDRILHTCTGSSGGTYRIILNVYDAALTLLRSLDLYDSLLMADMSDTTGAGRVSNFTHNNVGLINYSGLGVTYGFTWNPFNETFHQLFNSYFTYDSSAGAAIGQGIGLNISFSIPRTWLDSGVGTVVNNIPTKAGTYRYNMLSDPTWGTVTGGMSSTFVGGANGSLITDEYSGDMWFTYKGSFTAALAANNVYRYKANAGHVYQTLDSNANFAGQFTLGGGISIPDGSPWSKVLYTYHGHVIGNNILMRTNSTRYGDVYVQTTFDTSSFSSVQAGVTNDTLKLDSAGAIINPGSVSGTTWPAVVNSNFRAGNMGTVVIGGVPTHYFCNGGSLVYTITATGSIRNFTSTGVTMPIVPSAIDALTGVVDQDCVAWNGDAITPVWWAVVRDTTGMAYMAKNVGGNWTIVSGNMFQVPIDAGKTSRGDALNNITITIVSGHPLLTGNGRFLFNFSISVTGGTFWYWGCFDINTNAVTYGTLSQFAPLGTGPGKYGNVGGYPGSTFGYSTTLGYYRYTATSVFDAAFFCSSIDVRGVGAPLTEDQWFNHSATRYEVWITTESATGLVAYLSAFPIFLGGYYSTMATQSVVLQPNTDNYIYAARNAADRSLIDVTVSGLQLPSSFSRVLLAKVTTDASRIVGQVNYAIAQHDAIEDLENVAVTNKVVGDGLLWSGSNWTNNQVSTPTQVSAAITAAVNAAVTSLQSQINALSATQVVPGTISWYGGTSAPAGYLVCDGAALSAASYPALYAAIGNTYGGNSTTFGLPDLRGEFIRGADLGRGVDAGRVIGSWQSDLFKTHAHTISGARTFAISMNDINGTVLPPNRTDFGNAATAATDSTGGTETRPRNVALLPIIKY
jgi:microcystin-dependent protein